MTTYLLQAESYANVISEQELFCVGSMNGRGNPSKRAALAAKIRSTKPLATMHNSTFATCF
jgi:hypothetical protein